MLIFLTALAAFAAGVLISFINYLITRKLSKNGGSLAVAAPLRTVLSVLLLTGCYFLGSSTSLSLYALLIGAALGLTAGLAYFTFRLAKKGGGEGKE